MYLLNVMFTLSCIIPLATFSKYQKIKGWYRRNLNFTNQSWRYDDDQITQVNQKVNWCPCMVHARYPISVPIHQLCVLVLLIISLTHKDKHVCCQRYDAIWQYGTDILKENKKIAKIIKYIWLFLYHLLIGTKLNFSVSCFVNPFLYFHCITMFRIFIMTRPPWKACELRPFHDPAHNPTSLWPSPAPVRSVDRVFTRR